jgi:hypothetical protein
MDTQFLLEEVKTITNKEVTKEIITDESMIVGGTVISIEITDVATIEFKKRSRFLA